jgi:hypothetical protein
MRRDLHSVELVFVAANLDPRDWILNDYPISDGVVKGALQRSEYAGN